MKTLQQTVLALLIAIARAIPLRLVFSVILRATIPQASFIPLTSERITVKITETILSYSILTTTEILVLNSEWDHHKLTTEQLDVSLDEIKQSLSIATTIDSNVKLFWIRLKCSNTLTATPLPFQHHSLGLHNSKYNIPYLYRCLCSSHGS